MFGKSQEKTKQQTQKKVIYGAACNVRHQTGAYRKRICRVGLYSASGSAAEPVCLPKDPDFVKTSGRGYGHMYGAEFDGNYFASNSANQDVPFAVCRVKQASSVIMIPGKNWCVTGWNMEYNGYLASNDHSNAAAGSFVCIAIQPEYINGGSSWNGGSKLFYDVVAKCGSLRCPPYKQDYPLTCVVCSK
ncbi:unnamed protein product [Mytilus coruscus]|uniref:Uncharacterized protein n=1 Tax=Mytilus coruscus TaxID=42192 RepID=A0A6J8EJP9_MYTCO|nr:unnamed protein product [Mytilus coruscus]